MHCNSGHFPLPQGPACRVPLILLLVLSAGAPRVAATAQPAAAPAAAEVPAEPQPAIAVPAAPGAAIAGQAAADELPIGLRPRPLPMVFLHIPKTGGTSLALLFQELMSEANCTRLPLTAGAPPPPPARCRWAHVFNGAGDGRPHDRAYLLAAAAGTAPPVELDYAFGHLHYGYCALLNATRPGRGCCDCTYTTVLRHPLARLVSHYGWIMRTVPHVLTEKCPHCAAGIDAFAAALANDTAGGGRLMRELYLDNTMTRVLSGDGLWSSLTRNRLVDVSRRADSKMLARAKLNLEHDFPLIGFTEDLPRYVPRLRRLLGLPAGGGGGGGGGGGLLFVNAAPRDGGKGGGRRGVDALRRETREALLRLQARDLHLYEFAQRLQRRRDAVAPQ
ncbi:hypothetical protein Rsub_06262 [Raphidocelis subcapitata]|uniref:Sulfotransferase n=1 Tax=Raphidocelis subcapitata TaxID=307507 RepID=A0A2V0P3Q8_9CHLO|nr:hypothetical protein Rsub_06262 [Raphidocelis subcapitata]|eukprot:GBF93542.1 hypothetical protein Rsub_06262 [Raphidocelis subcapitata]